MCVINIILHTLLLVDVCGNINTIFYSVVVYKDHYYSLKFFFYNQNSLFDMLEGTIIDCRVFLWS